MSQTLLELVCLRVFVVLQDYNDHIAEISAKLVAIMDGLFEKFLSKVRSSLFFFMNFAFDTTTK